MLLACALRYSTALKGSNEGLVLITGTMTTEGKLRESLQVLGSTTFSLVMFTVQQ